MAHRTSSSLVDSGGGANGNGPMIVLTNLYFNPVYKVHAPRKVAQNTLTNLYFNPVYKIHAPHL